MITGFNTDVEFEGVTYHVQTEDKGLETPLILSLVYHRGTILASKRSPYEDLLKSEFDEKILAERLQKQHKLICAAIRGGRLEDLKRMTMKDSEARKAEAATARAMDKALVQPKIQTVESQTIQKIAQNVVNNKTIQHQTAEIKNMPSAEMTQVSVNPQKIAANTDKIATAPLPPVLRTADRIGQKLAEKIDHVKSEIPAAPPNKNSLSSVYLKSAEPEIKASPIPKPSVFWEETPKNQAEQIFEAVEIVDEEMILPAEAVAVVEAVPSAEELKNKSLEIGFLNETEFKGGDRKTVSLIVWRGHHENGIANAQVMVKILGSSFRPMIFHAKTDTNGVATVHLQLPHFRAGRAAILIRALAGGEEIEMRRVITHG